MDELFWERTKKHLDIDLSYFEVKFYRGRGGGVSHLLLFFYTNFFLIITLANNSRFLSSHFDRSIS